MFEKLTDEDLDKEAFDNLEDEHAEVNEEEEGIAVEEKEVVEEKVSDSTDEESVADKARVPYSRFETVNERAIKAETELELLKKGIGQQSSGKAESTEDIELPAEWVELYGDSDAAKRAYELQVKSLERMREDITTKAFEELEKRQSEKQKEVEKNIELIDNSLKEFQEQKKIKFTEADETAILDIQDEWTPKDEKGNYLTPLIPVEKAYEIYTLRQASAKADKVVARRKVVAITSSGNEGESSSSDANYDARAWGSWRSKL